MIDFKIRKNSKLILIISKQESENSFLMQAMKLTFEQLGLDMSNVSFGFYDRINESDLLIPLNNAIVFSNLPTKVILDNSKEIHCLPPLLVIASNTDIQNQALKQTAISIQKRL